MQYLISLQIHKERALKRNPQRMYDKVGLGYSKVRLGTARFR